MLEKKRIPEELLDPNIASDYTKVRRIFKIKNQEHIHLDYLEELLRDGQIKSALVRQYEISRRFDRKRLHQFALLYGHHHNSWNRAIQFHF